jgi:hypothetical protein
MAAPRIKKPFVRTAGNGKLSRRVAKIESGIQTKHNDTIISGSTYAYDSWFTAELNVVDQGDADTERVGDRINNLCLDINFLVKQNGSNSNATRMIVIWDKQNSISTQANLLSGGTAAYSYLSHFNYDTQSQFTVLFDKLILHDGTYNDSWLGTHCIQLRNRSTRFNAGSTTINTGSLKIFLLSDVIDSGSKPAMWMTIRHYFVD